MELWTAKEQFDFSGRLDLERFIKTAQSLGLFHDCKTGSHPLSVQSGNLVDCQPGSWKKDMHPLIGPSLYQAVDRYYDHLLGLLTRYQVDQGSWFWWYSWKWIALMEDSLSVPFRIWWKKKRRDLSHFTSDGPWRATLETEPWSKMTSLWQELAPKQPNFVDTEFFDEYGKKWPWY